MTEHAVVVAGAGPTGMMLAAELTLAGTDVVVVEPRPTFELESARSRGLHARTIEVFDQRGIAERFLTEGQAMQVQAFAGIPLDISDFPSRHPYGLALAQRHVERIMSGWVDELGVQVVRGRRVERFAQHDDEVVVTLDDGTSIAAEWLVGCDGGRSAIRRGAGIEFVGWDATTCWIHAEVAMEETPPFGLRGGGGIGPAEGGLFGVTLIEPDTDRSDEPTLDDLRAALRRVDGSDHGAHSPRFISRFTDATRQAVAYRDGRVLLAGDSAHVHAPLGGQGLNLGVQDAVNLGWKLARVVAGTSPASLLDTYHDERHPVAARVLANTLAQRAVGTAEDRSGAFRALLVELLAMPEPRRHLAGTISGLDIRYDLGEGHPLLGRRMPDLALTTDSGPTRVAELLHAAEPVLLDLGGHARVAGASDVDLGPWADRVRLVRASSREGWELPVVGPVPAVSAVLIRPDGHVAWTDDEGTDRLTSSLTTWFGPPHPTGG